MPALPAVRECHPGGAGRRPRPCRVMLVGEQPGDKEDLAGKPFVGPAGKLLDRALADAGIPRDETFVTNAVKHFKFEPRGKRRLHKKPNAYEIERCKWWLDQERAIVQPEVIVALGATAARSLLGRAVTITKLRAETLRWPTAHARRHDPSVRAAAHAGRGRQARRLCGVRAGSEGRVQESA